MQKARPSKGTPRGGQGASPSGQFRVPQLTAQQLRAQQQQEEEDAAMDALDDALIFDDEEGGTRIGDIYIPPPVPPHCSMESVGPRLIIAKIVNHNFKSYAGTVVLGPFHQSFTAIIGPNGSGKSNVIDSMMFVFGCRANRIRCKRVSTLIHSSSKFQNLRSCSVAVHFKQIVDKGDGSCEDVPNSNIVIERTAMSDNSSYYMVNGKRAQLKDVAKLLKQHHVDLEHNRFLILQGEVESIAMMKPKGQTENETGMLEYLEDIVGTKRYIRPLQQINQRVDQLTDDRTEKHNRCKLAEREMKDLEQPFNEAVDYLKKENEMVRTKSVHIQKIVSIKKTKLEQYTKEHETCVEEIKTHDEGTAALRQEREEKETVVRKEIEAYESLVKTREQIKKRLATVERAHTEIQSTMESTNKQRKKDKTQVEKNDKELEDLHKLPEKNQREIEDCTQKLESLEKNKVTLNEELEKQQAELTNTTAPLTEKRLQLSDDLVGLNGKVNAAKAELQVLESQLKILKQAETTESRKYETLKSSYEQSQKSLEEKVTRVDELNESIPRMKSEIANKTAEVDKMVKEERNLSMQCNKLRTEINERSSVMQAQRSNNKVLNFLMRLKMEGKIPGILGRLGDLGGIDAKYDVAISTACGRLDNIVTDSYDTAAAAIAALKEHNVGRATFITLDKIEQHRRDANSRINTPENVPRLYDLVKVEDDRVRTAFYFALRNTLVCDDLDQGTRIAYGRERFRVVTLRGEMIEMTGTMSGGGNRPVRGKMDTQVRTKTAESADSSQMTQKALEEMQIQAEELQTRVNYCQEQQGSLEREIQTLKMVLQRDEAEYKKLAVSITSLEQQMASNLKQCEAQRQRMLKKTTDEGAVKELEEQIEAAKQEVEQAQFAEQAVTSQIEEIQTQYDTLRNDNVKPVEAKIKKVGSQIEKLAANVRSLKVALTSADRNIKKISENNNNLRENITAAEEKLKSLNEDRNKCQEKKEALEKEAGEADAAIEGAKSQSSDIKKQIDEITKEENKRNLDRVEIDAKLQAAAGKMNKVKAEIPGWQSQLVPLKLNEIPGETEPPAPLKELSEEELEAESLEALQYKQTMLEEDLKTKKPNLGCIKEFNERRIVYLDRVRVLEDITSKRNEMRDKYEEVRKRRYNEFMSGFFIITRKLKEMYQMITLGGDAELELVDSMDPFNEGVNFTVRPPKKSWKYISNLSGGEKTLSSLALVFALHYYKPSPLYFMDEIDAALDFKNVSIVGHYIKERTKNAQFIIVSLRVNMFELANYLVGIYKVSDCTSSCTVRNHPPDLASKQATRPHSQYAGGTVAQDQTLLPVNNENQSPDSQARPSEQVTHMGKQLGRETTFAPPLESTARETIRPSEPGSQTSRQLGRETTFAPTIESTGRGTTFEQNVDRAVVKDVLEVPNAPQRFSTDVNLESPPSSPTVDNV
ncbi:structural maintenance of chromosomes protein 4 [Drosophila gunungcola]|uniref:structural maintenance of chromosomes protein 4 n=1 Tax=Drosophila gunungcola TaxID=103775 RepID=UPI0022E30C65|nr:structural maintenance of chromosomes protein 4 [Drosophila gunungcola]